MHRPLRYVVPLLASLAVGSAAQAQVFSDPDPNEPDHIRGTIASYDGSSMEVDTDDGQKLQIAAPDTMTVIKLSKGSFTKVDFGTYVGSVSVKLDKYSPIVRDSLSFLHDGFELRIIDEALRGIAAGHRYWDLTPESVIAHGWVDDMEGRVISVKYGPTEEEETDVEVSRDVPVLRMGLGDLGLVKEGQKVFVGAQNDGGAYTAAFIFVGEDGVVPPL